MYSMLSLIDRLWRFGNFRLYFHRKRMQAQLVRSVYDRDWNLVQHGVLRSMLAGHMGCECDQLDICSKSHGKAFLTDKDGEGSLKFSLSHSGAYAAFAFDRYEPISKKSRNEVLIMK